MILKKSVNEGTSVFNECRNCHSKWMTTLSEPYLTHLKLITSIQ